jgi:hypothetical protein
MKKKQTLILLCFTCIVQLSIKASCVEARINNYRYYGLEVPVPVGVPDSGVIRNLRLLVETEPEARELWQQLQVRAESYLSEKPDPIERINYEGMLNNHPDRIATVSHLYDMMRVEIWLSAWLITGDSRYEKIMRQYLLAWAKTYKPTGNPINENKLDPLLTAAVVLADRLERNEKNIVLKWLKDLAEAEINSVETMPWSVENNWHPKRLKIVALAAEVLDNNEWRDWVVEETRNYIARALRPDGSSRDFEQRDALSYHISGVRPLLRLISLLPFEYREELYSGKLLTVLQWPVLLLLSSHTHWVRRSTVNF